MARGRWYGPWTTGDFVDPRPGHVDITATATCLTQFLADLKGVVLHGAAPLAAAARALISESERSGWPLGVRLCDQLTHQVVGY
jgi:hypothetical protein